MIKGNKKSIPAIFLAGMLSNLILLVWIFYFPRHFTSGLILPAGAFYVPVYSFALTILILIIFRKSMFSLALIWIPLLSIILFLYSERYFKYLDDRRTAYSLLSESNQPSYSMFTTVSPNKEMPTKTDPILETRAYNKMKHHLPQSWVIDRLQLDSGEEIVWFEVVRPSFWYGSASLFAYYDIPTGQISNYITAKRILDALYLHGGSKSNDLHAREMMVDSVIIQDIYEMTNQVKIIKENRKLMIE